MNRPRSKIDTHFQEPGSLPRPGPVGRLVRLLTGAWLIMGAYSIVSATTFFFTGTRAPELSNWTFWLYVLFAFAVTPYVVNIGFGKSWRRWPRTIVGVAAAVLVVGGLLAYGSWWSPLLGVFVWLWLIYISVHLGVSFLVSAAIATPGCEMRGLPHLWTLLSGHETHEHYCPGPLDRIDAWERRRTS